MNDHERIENLLETLKAMEHDLREQQRESARASHRAWPHVLLAVVGCLALFNIYYVNKLFAESEGMITSMTQMYIHFGRVAARMSDMRDYVAGMEGNITMMPIIDDEMAAMSSDIGAMSNNVGAMNHYVGVMDQRVATLGVTVPDMSQRFRHLNYNVGRMSFDVRQMAEPVP